MKRWLCALSLCALLGCGTGSKTENTGVAPEPLKGAPPGMGPPGQGPAGPPSIPKPK